MKIKLSKKIKKAVVEAAADGGMSEDEFVNDLIEYSFDYGLADLQMAGIEKMLTNEILPRIKILEAGDLSRRYQILKLHTDISDGPERAEAVLKKGQEIAYEAIYKDEKQES